MTVALRFGFRAGRAPDAELGSLICVGTAALLATAAALLDREGTQLSLRDAAFFALAGLIAPGASQLLFTRAVRDAGPSRTSVVVGTAPLFAAAVAILFLDEPIEAPLMIGGVLVVAAGLLLVSEPTRPEHVRLSGIAVAIAAGAVGTLLYLLATRGRRLGADAGRIAWKPFAVGGIFFGLSYVCLFAAYYRARVTVVSPLVATESLWGVTLSVLLFKRTELVGARLLGAAILVVAGGTLISVFR